MHALFTRNLLPTNGHFMSISNSWSNCMTGIPNFSLEHRWMSEKLVACNCRLLLGFRIMNYKCSVLDVLSSLCATNWYYPVVHLLVQWSFVLDSILYNLLWRLSYRFDTCKWILLLLSEALKLKVSDVLSLLRLRGCKVNVHKANREHEQSVNNVDDFLQILHAMTR